MATKKNNGRTAKKTPDAADKRRIANAYRRLIDDLAQRRIGFVVIGAQAVRAYVPTRETNDLDLLVAEADVDQVVRVADSHWERCRNRVGGVRVLRDRGCCAEVHVRPAREQSEMEALESTVRVQLFARKVRVPAPEYLVVMKLASMRGQRKHWDDTIALIRSDYIDVRFVVAHLVREHPGLIELFLELVTRASPRPRRPARPKSLV